MTWHRALPVAKLREAGRALFRHGGKQIVLFDVEGEIRALDNRCPHEGYPLFQGTVDPERCLLTCQWHNWKFDLASGKALVGEDHVRSYRARVVEDDIEIDVTDPPVEAIEKAALGALEEAITAGQYRHVARELARMLSNGLDPLGGVRRAVELTHDRFEYGTTHAFAAAADWLTLYVEESDMEHRVLCLTEAIDHMADDALRQPFFAFAKNVEPFSDEAFLEAVEAEDEPRAVGLMRGALENGIPWSELEPTLARAALSHYNSFGHAAIYVHKTGELLRLLGAGSSAHLLLPLARYLCYTTREDLLPDAPTPWRSKPRPRSVATDSPGSTARRCPDRA